MTLRHGPTVQHRARLVVSPNAPFDRQVSPQLRVTAARPISPRHGRTRHPPGAGRARHLRHLRPAQAAGPRSRWAGGGSSSSPNTSRRATSRPRSRELVGAARDGEQTQVLLGVTGSGKTFTMAKVIEELQRPALVLAPNKILAAQLYGEFKSFFPEQRGRVFRQLLRLLPARSLRARGRTPTSRRKAR